MSEYGPCYVLPDGECISPFKCAHGDGLSLDEFVRRITTASVPPPLARKNSGNPTFDRRAAPVNRRQTMADNQSTNTVPTCPTCGEPCTFETTIGIRYCANAHAWKAPDYPRVDSSTGRARSEENDG